MGTNTIRTHSMVAVKWRNLVIAGLAILISVETTIAQYYFNKTFDFAQGIELGGSSRQLQDCTFISIGSDQGKGGFWIFKNEANGDLIWTKLYSDTNYIFYIGNGPSMVQLASGNLMLAGSIVDTSGISDILILKIKPNGDTILFKIIEFGYESIAKGCMESDDGFFLVTGATKINSNSDWQAFLIKSDSSGNVIWQNSYGNGMIEVGFTISEAEEKGFLICGQRASANTAMPYVVRTDSLGNLKWQNVYGTGDKDNSGCMGQRMSDGNHVLSSAIDYNDGMGLEGYAAKINDSGSVIWEKSFGISLNDAFTTTPIQGSNGEIFFCGLSSGLALAWIMKITADGDSVWSRQYSNPLNFFNNVHNFTRSSDGGFLITGYALGPQSWDVWLLKLDSLGCDTPGCQFLSRGSGVPHIPAYLFPNPASDNIQLEFPGETSGFVEIFDLTGLCVFQENVYSPHIRINLSHFMPGIYIWRFTTDDGQQATGKLSVVR